MSLERYLAPSLAGNAILTGVVIGLGVENCQLSKKYIKLHAQAGTAVNDFNSAIDDCDAFKAEAQATLDAANGKAKKVKEACDLALGKAREIIDQDDTLIALCEEQNSLLREGADLLTVQVELVESLATSYGTQLQICQSGSNWSFDRNQQESPYSETDELRWFSDPVEDQPRN